MPSLFSMRAPAHRAETLSPFFVLTFALLLAVLLSTLARAAEENAPAKKPAAEERAPLAAVPMPELSAQAEATTINLREIGEHAAADGPLAAIDKGLPRLTAIIDARLRENARIVSQRPSLELLRALERAWDRQLGAISGMTAQLEQRIAVFDRDLARLDELEKIWKETQAAAVKEQAPPELLGRVEELLAMLARTRKDVEAKRSQALRLQSRIAAQNFRVTEAIESIARHAT